MTIDARTEPRRLTTSASRALGAVRLLAGAHVILIFGQPVYAGLYLSGDYDMLALHARGADYVSYLGCLQIAATVVLWLMKGPRWPLGASLLLTAGETAQYFAGLAGALDLHIPLGVVLIAFATVTVIGVWRPQTAPATRDRVDTTGPAR